MKILMVHPHDIASPNEPWTIRMVSLAREFRGKGHEVVVAYAPLEIKERKRNIELGGIGLCKLSRKAGLASLKANIDRLGPHARWAEVIHFQKCFHYTALPALLCGYRYGKPLHYEWDDWEEKIWYHSNNRSVHTQIFGNYLKVLERYIPLLTETVSVASDKLFELVQASGVDAQRIFKAPVGADLRRFSPRISGDKVRSKYHMDKRSVILYLGQLHAGQYVNMFIRAANAILHKRPDALFMILGTGFMAEQLKAEAVRCGIEDKVLFVGSVEHDQIPHYIGAADICVASFEENEVTVCKSPLKIVEYLASGKPIVASLVGEVRDMVGGVGLLVEPGDSRGLADAVMNLLGNPQLMVDMGVLARRRAEEKYNWAHTAETLLRAYEKAICLHEK